MIEFTQNGVTYRGYTSLHYFADGLPVSAEQFRAALVAQHPHNNW